MAKQSSLSAFTEKISDPFRKTTVAKETVPITGLENLPLKIDLDAIKRRRKKDI